MSICKYSSNITHIHKGNHLHISTDDIAWGSDHEGFVIAECRRIFHMLKALCTTHSHSPTYLQSRTSGRKLKHPPIFIYMYSVKAPRLCRNLSASICGNSLWMYVCILYRSVKVSPCLTRVPCRYADPGNANPKSVSLNVLGIVLRILNFMLL